MIVRLTLEDVSSSVYMQIKDVVNSEFENLSGEVKDCYYFYEGEHINCYISLPTYLNNDFNIEEKKEIEKEDCIEVEIEYKKNDSGENYNEIDVKVLEYNEIANIYKKLGLLYE